MILFYVYCMACAGGVCILVDYLLESYFNFKRSPGNKLPDFKGVRFPLYMAILWAVHLTLAMLWVSATQSRPLERPNGTTGLFQQFPRRQRGVKQRSGRAVSPHRSSTTREASLRVRCRSLSPRGLQPLAVIDAGDSVPSRRFGYGRPVRSALFERSIPR